MKKYWLLFLLPWFFACDEKETFEYDATKINIEGLESIYNPESVSLIMQKVCDWQISHPVERNGGNGMAWARSAFYAGVMATYQSTLKKKYLHQVKLWATSKRWLLDKRYDHADDHASGQTYLDIYLIEKKSYQISSTQKTFDKILQEGRVGRELYWWADALFMSPPVLSRLYAATHDEKYINFLNKMWWDAHDFLYDKKEHLFFQSHWFFKPRTSNGKKIFWARANGWVMAGTVRVMQYMPKSNFYYQDFIHLHQEMAAAVINHQQDDGLWRPSLLDPEQAPYPETSSSSFYIYAIAWGINNGYLDEQVYLPVVKKAWASLVGAIHPDGKLGWVQPGGSEPDEVTYDDYQEFGAGAFLLAGSEIYKLNLQ